VKFWKEKDILEYFPTALYSMAMIGKSGGSLEKGFKFVATHDFGRISQLCNQVLEVALKENLEAGLDSIRDKSDNRYYREAIMVMTQYAKHSSPFADRLVGLGNRMQSDAVLARRRHYQRVENALVPQTTMLQGGFPFLLICIYGLLTEPVMAGQEPILSMENLYYIIIVWFGIMAFAYPLLYTEYILKNPVYITPNFDELKRMFGTHYDAQIARFLNNTANYIEMGWSLEMAVSHAIPNQLSSGISGDDGWARRALHSLNYERTSFGDALLSVGGWANSRKFNLTIEFIEEARNSRYASLAETLKLLADSFWASHMTVRHYQSEIVKPVGFSIGFKMVSMFVMAMIFFPYAPLIIFFFALDFVLMGVSLL